MTLICNNLAGKANAPAIGNYRENLVMMKYVELKVTDAKV